MAFGVVEETLVGQAGEIVYGARRFVVGQQQTDVALVGRHAGADYGWIGWHLAGARRLDRLDRRLLRCSCDAGYFQLAPRLADGLNAGNGATGGVVVGGSMAVVSGEVLAAVVAGGM